MTIETRNEVLVTCENTPLMELLKHLAKDHAPDLDYCLDELARDWLRMRNDLCHLTRVLEDFAASPDSAPADRFAARQLRKLLNGVTSD